MSATYAQRSVDVADEHGRVFKAWFLTNLPGDEVQWAAGLLLAAPADDRGLPLPDHEGVAELWRNAREALAKGTRPMRFVRRTRPAIRVRPDGTISIFAIDYDMPDIDWAMGKPDAARESPVGDFIAWLEERVEYAAIEADARRLAQTGRNP